MPLIAGYAHCYVESNSDFPVNDFLFARSQMGMSLAFHIVFAAIGISLPVLMVISEALYLRTGRPVFLELAKRWSRGAAILFAVGAVSGTVLSFELGLLWPGFMEKSGAIIGMPFSLEGFAFFTEAIFLGLYLMGWKRLPPLVHWFCGVLVILGGVTSGIFVVTANAWMNTPAGFKILDGKITDIDPIAAMLNPAAAHEVLHMTLAAFIATGFAVAAIHAFFLLRDRRNAFHRNALGMALALACTSAPLQLPLHKPEPARSFVDRNKTCTECAARVGKWRRPAIDHAERARHHAIAAAVANIILHENGADFCPHD